MFLTEPLGISILTRPSDDGKLTLLSGLILTKLLATTENIGGVVGVGVRVATAEGVAVRVGVGNAEGVGVTVGVQVGKGVLVGVTVGVDAGTRV